jgi:hypothetical protein
MLCKICRFHGGDYEEHRFLGYENPVLTSQETHYVSATEPSRIMPYKISGFHGDDYEEFLLVGYKNPVRTSQETHYFSATESNWLMISIGLRVCYINIIITILDNTSHSVFYLNCTVDIVRTSQETHYVSAMSPTG